MAPSSQGPVGLSTSTPSPSPSLSLSVPTTSNKTHARQSSAQGDRPPKRTRFTPQVNRRDDGAARKENEVSSRQEKDLMEDLLAGLDAEMLDGFQVSPVKVQPVSAEAEVKKEIRSPLRVKAENGTPSRARRAPLPKSVGSSARGGFVASNAIVPIKTETETETKVDIHPPAQPEAGPSRLSPALPDSHSVEDVKPIIADDDVFDFEFDLSDLGALDDEAFKPLPPKPRWPALHPPIPVPPDGYAPTPWARCTVDAVFQGLRFEVGAIPDLEQVPFAAAQGIAPGKTLVVTQSADGSRRTVHLKERWADLEAKKGDTVNIIAPTIHSDPSQPIIITFKDPSSFIIHHPDLMLTMTSIANAMPCPRKPILQSLLKVPGPPTKAILYGNIQHALLQSSLTEQSFEEEATRRRLDDELRKESTRLEIWGAGMDVQEIRMDLGARAGRGFEVFANKWVGPAPKKGGELHSTLGDDPDLLAINGLHDVEEDIWSPKWGLKGKVDASVQARILRDAPASHGGSAEERVAPLEIKTGRSVGMMAHRAQTMLYTLLMEDRYGIPVPAGLLYYSQLDSILRVEAKSNEIRALITVRNELAGWLAKQRTASAELAPVQPPAAEVADIEDTFLPPTIDHPRECKSCYAVDTCMLYRKTVDRVDAAPDDPIAELYEDKAGHLTERDAVFFRKWESLVTVEEQELGRFRSQLWTMTAKQREKTGRCFGDMIIESYSNDIGRSLAKIHRHTYTFIRAPTSSQHTRSLLSGHIAKGDPVSLSIEPDLLCLSRGFVVDLTPERITIGVTYVIDTAALLARTALRDSHKVEGEVRFRIDKDEMASGMQRMRNNLAQLFFADGDEKRRRLIVDLEKPTFEPARAPLPEEIPASLNEDQRRAMDKVFTARDYALILGMPGTGKTTTIAEIIKALVERGKTVLLASYTHSAVDTILMKLLNAEFGVLRLGNIDKVHPDVQHLTLEALDASKDMNQLDQRLMSPPVVAATCLAIDHPLFFRRKFDYCIVDEASQITLPTCLGPLRMAETFVLVGDHFQLPPIVRNAEARKGGLDVSLFKLLSESHPDAVVDLSHQYRMNEDIMLLSNELIYEGRLKCGTEAVAKQGLVLPHRKKCQDMYHGAICGARDESCWVQDLLEENVKAVFVDTDLVPALDARAGDLVQNPTEAKLVRQLAAGLTASGIKQEDIAVITPYRQQIKLLTGLFVDLPRVEILTADKSQGRDKDCVLISLVRSNEVGYIGDLLRDWRRINVSFTRAKRKLVIFGSRNTLASDCLLAGFLRLMDSKSWIYALPKGADELHPLFNDLESETMCMKGKGVVKQEGEDRGGKGERKVGRAAEGILNGRPFGKEVLEEIQGSVSGVPA